MIKSTERTWFSVLLGIIIVALIASTFPRDPHQPHGLILPSEKTRAQTSPAAIVLFSQVTAPNQYQSIGRINISQHFTGKSRQSEKAILQKARKLAASLGANAIIVRIFGHSVLGSVPAAQAIYVFRGEAIYSKQAQQTGGDALLGDQL